MPIFEFTCKDCNKIFEEIVLGSEDIECPECKSKNVSRLISRPCRCSGFSAGDCSQDSSASATPSAPSGCAGCSGGSCATCR